MKNELSMVFIRSKEFLEDKFENEYYKSVDNLSFYEDWIKDYVTGYSPDKIQ